MPAQTPFYQAEPADQLVVEPLDAMTLIYHRRSGITHMVAEPVPEILAAMDGDCLTVAFVVERLSAHFDLGDPIEAATVVAARLEELAELGLVARAVRNA